MENLLILFFVVLAIVFLVVIVYQKLYASKMNQALEGKTSRGLLDPWQVLSLVSLIIIVVLTVMTYSKISYLEDQIAGLNSKLNNQSSYISSLQNQLNSLENDFEDYLDGEKLIQNENNTVVGINENSLVYRISFSLKEKNSSDEISLVLRNELEEEAMIDLSSNSLSYTEDITLSLSHRFTIFVLINGSTLKQLELFEINPSSDLDHRYEQYSSYGYSPSSKMIDGDISIKNQFASVDQLQTQKVVITFYYNDEVLNTITLTGDEISIIDGNEYIHYYFEFSNIADGDLFDFEISITDQAGRVTNLGVK